MEFINKYKIKQVYISKSIHNLSNYFPNYEYKNKEESTLFIGLYNLEDINCLKNHLGKKYIFWFDNECNPYIEIRRKITLYVINNIKIDGHFVNSMNTAKYLNIFNINYEVIYDYFTNDIPKYKILTNKKLNSIAKNLNENLINLGYESNIIESLTEDLECKSYIYIIIYVKYFTELQYIPPRKYILYQMEQNGSNMINDNYYSLGDGAMKIYDFSESNMKIFNFNKNKYLFNPFSLSYISQNLKEIEPEFDILFYGQFNERRLKILEYLKNIFNIKYVENVLGDERDELIKKCKFVLNLHFYEDACLETCRINEVIKYNKFVVSEEPNENDLYNRNLYNNCVIYFDIININLNNINILVDKINFSLNNYDKLKKEMDVNKIYKITNSILENNIKFQNNNEINDGNYIPNSNVHEYIVISNPKKWIFEKYDEIKNKENVIDIDWIFYKQANNLNLEFKYELLNHLYMNGYENGLIYHPKQLINIYSDIKINNINDKIYVNKILLNEFIKNNVYNKSYDFFLDKFIKEIKNNITKNHKLLIICFIGDLEIGIKLIDKVIIYSQIQNFNLCIVYNKNLKIKIDPIIFKLKYLNYIIYECHEFGNDIIPTLLSYDKINNLMNFDYVIKLHTKGDNIWFNDLTDFLLNDKLENKFHFKDSCNCIGHPDYIVRNRDNQCSYLINKYDKIINKSKFIKGTIFLCKSVLFNKIIKIIKQNYKSYLFNNLYDTNAINENKSYIHFLERLFGLLNLDK